MSEETLLTAARRVARLFRIDQAHGGLVSVETIQAVEILDIQIAREAGRKRRETMAIGNVVAIGPVEPADEREAIGGGAE